MPFILKKPGQPIFKKFRQSVFKKSGRKSLPVSSTTPYVLNQPVSTHLDPISLEPIGGRGEITMNAIETSLAALNDASAVAAKIPFSSPVASLLLQALAMRNEVKQHKEEWTNVMDKLERIASLVDKASMLCQEYNLEERDVPRSLRAIFESLVSELEGIKRSLIKNNKVVWIKKLILRKDLLGKVKQHDGKLSTVLQTFQAELSLDVRFAQIAESLKATHSSRTGPSDASEVVRSIQRGAPHRFFGQVSELVRMTNMTNLGAPPVFFLKPT